MSQHVLTSGVTDSVAFFRMFWRSTKPAKGRYYEPKIKKVTDVGTIKILLRDTVVPKTCQNFKALCTHEKGFGYTGSSFHHIVRGFGVYGGDIVNRIEKRQPFDEDFTGLEWNAEIKPHGRPTNLPMPFPVKGLLGRSSFGPANPSDYVFEDEYQFEDENFEIKHDKAGIITMANVGPNTNNSNFVILTAPAPWLDGKNVAFGQVIQGLDLIIEMDKRLGSDCGEPLHEIVISQCGLLDYAEQDIPDEPEPKEIKEVKPEGIKIYLDSFQT